MSGTTEAVKGSVEALTRVYEAAGAKFTSHLEHAKAATKEGFAKAAAGLTEELATIRAAEGVGGKFDAVVMKNPKVAIGAALIGGAIAAKLLSGGKSQGQEI